MNIHILLNEFCYYSQFNKGYKELTIKRYRDNIGFCIRYLATTDLYTYTTTNLNKFFDYGNRVRNWSPNTFINYHKSLLVFFNWCVKNQYVRENPVINIETPKLRQIPRKKLSANESLHILNTLQNYPFRSEFIRKRNVAIIALFLYTGIRKSELLKVTLRDVNFETQCISIHCAKRDSFRTIPITLKLSRFLHEYLEERIISKKTCPEFFCSFNRNMGYTGSGLRRLIKKITNASGIKITAHILRHTFATLMLEGGCDIFSLSKILGHRKIQTTSIYLLSTQRHLTTQIYKHPLN